MKVYIDIILNGKKFNIIHPSTCLDLLKVLSYDKVTIALEVNNKIISKSKLSTTELTTNDKVEIVKAVGGG